MNQNFEIESDTIYATCEMLADYIKSQKNFVRDCKEVLSKEDRQEERAFLEELILDAESRMKSAWQLLGEFLDKEKER